MEDEDVRRFRRQMKLLQRRLRREVLPVGGLSHSEVQVLAVIVRTDAVTPRSVADELRMTSSNVAAALRELEADGLVTRERDPQDGRRVKLSLTQRGAGLVAAFRSERDTWLGRAITTQLTAEESACLARAGDLMERLSHFAPEGPPDVTPARIAPVDDSRTAAEGKQ
ncbi:MarR family winged helix-turn-helix transcriptional regulator [Streptomyces sp. NPDC058231]|uniref:MarR family winged helix-turn-helix transcriptional regulator n=1 Tax=Streptomyces sp. NPDC058231 TaxID=3346392 RepID=UPI0036ED4CA4